VALTAKINVADQNQRCKRRRTSACRSCVAAGRLGARAAKCRAAPYRWGQAGFVLLLSAAAMQRATCCLLRRRVERASVATCLLIGTILGLFMFLAFGRTVGWGWVWESVWKTEWIACIGVSPVLLVGCFPTGHMTVTSGELPAGSAAGSPCFHASPPVCRLRAGSCLRRLALSASVPGDFRPVAGARPHTAQEWGNGPRRGGSTEGGPRRAYPP